MKARALAKIWVHAVGIVEVLGFEYGVSVAATSDSNIIGSLSCESARGTSLDRTDSRSSVSCPDGSSSSVDMLAHSPSSSACARIAVTHAC